MCRKHAIDTHLDYSTQTFLLHSNLPYDLQSHGPWHTPPTLKVPWIPYIVISKNLKYLGSIFNTNRLAGRPAVNYLNSQRNLYLYSGQVLISCSVDYKQLALCRLSIQCCSAWSKSYLQFRSVKYWDENSANFCTDSWFFFSKHCLEIETNFWRISNILTAVFS